MLSALDFAETRSENDARLLTTARGRSKGDRMSDDEAKALRRKVGGTASELFLIRTCPPFFCLKLAPLY